MNIQDFDRLYRRTKKESGDSNAVVKIRLGPVGSRTLRVLTHVTVENRTNPFTKCRLAIADGAVTHYIDELTTIAKDELAVSRSDILLLEGDYFFAELTGTTTGDDLVMTCIGWDKDL